MGLYKSYILNDYSEFTLELTIYFSITNNNNKSQPYVVSLGLSAAPSTPATCHFLRVHSLFRNIPRIKAVGCSKHACYSSFSAHACLPGHSKSLDHDVWEMCCCTKTAFWNVFKGNSGNEKTQLYIRKQTGRGMDQVK